MTRLGDVVNITSGFAFKSELFNDLGDGEPIIRIRDVGQGSSGTHYSGTYADEYVVSNGDLLIAMDGEFRLAEWSGGKALLNQRVCRIEPDVKKIDRRYLLHILPRQLKQIEDATPFVTVKHLSVKTIREIELLLPPLPTQRRIAAVLDKAQALVVNDRRTLAVYDQLAKSLFLEMFGDPVRNERGWEVKPFDQLVAEDCPLSYGIVQPGEEFEGGIPIVRPVDLDRRMLTAAGLKRIAPKIAAQYSRTQLRGDELLLSVRASIGLMAFATPELAGANVSRGVVPIWLRDGEATREFIFGLFENASFHQQLGTVVKGATLKGLNLKDLRSYLVIAPPIQLQRQFSSRMESILDQRVQAEQSLRQSEGLFGSLLQSAFTGGLGG